MVLDMDLDPLGSQPGQYRLYTQLAFVYPTSDSTQGMLISSTLRRGLERLSKSFPWLAGQVVNIDSDFGGIPTFKIRQMEPTPALTIKDYTRSLSIPTFTQFQEAKFPMQMLCEDIWAPCSTFSSPYEILSLCGSSEIIAPVMLVQMSFIQGGIVLCINLQHNVCDMMGQAAIMAWLSKACGGEEFTEHEIQLGKMDRKKVVPLIEQDRWSQGDLLLDDQILSSQQPSSNAAVASLYIHPTCSLVYFNFSATSLNGLKVLTSESLPSSCRFISADDAVSALIYQSVLRAREPRLDQQRVVKFQRAVDARRYLDVNPKYPGILLSHTLLKYPLSELLSTPLGHISAAMRAQVDPETSDIDLRTRALITYLAQSPYNVRNLNFTTILNPDADIFLSSWAKVPAFQWDFGLGLGLPEAVRRPSFRHFESLVYIMPKGRNGDIAVCLCLRNEDLERLVKDKEWTKFATYVG